MARLLIYTALGAVVEAIAVERMVAAPTDISLPSATFSFAQITAPPSLELLAKRQEAMTVLEAPDNTCGFVGGQIDSAYSCVDTDVKCAVVTYSNLVGAVGCCKGDECAVRATCVDYAELSSSCRRGSCQTTPYNLYWSVTPSRYLDTKDESNLTPCRSTSSASYCGTISYPNGIRDYFCQFTSNTTVGRAYTTYFGEMDDRSYTRRVLAVSTSSNPLKTSDVNIGATQVPTTVTASPTPGHDNNNSKGGSSIPVGAIVGGVVGGVAVLAIVALALFFIVRHHNKKKRQHQAIAAATGGYPQMAQQPGGATATIPIPHPIPAPAATLQPATTTSTPYTYTAGGGDMKPQAYAHVQPPSPAASPGITDPHNRQSYNNNHPASPTMTDVSSIQPHHTGSTMGGGGGGGYGYGNNGSGPNVPMTVHEAGGDAVGTHGPHSNHHGQFHELH
ncbi:hypothetical protein PG991_001386 [Apiospora marii]|uniref:Mid2 domain-containing protein n=1 Tax=Apiospora marii TaxID=335849 RepID=A0ABR1SS99_9PEZI